MKLTLKLIEKPNELNEKDKDKLLDDLTTIAQNGFGTEITKEEVALRTLDVDKLYLINGEGPIGFSTYSHFPELQLLYAHGTVLLQEHQHKGIYTRIKRTILDEIPHDYYALRTQNPLVYASTKKNVTDIFPNGKNMPKDVLDRANFLAQHLGMKINDKLVERGTYGCCLSDHVHNHPEATPFFRDVLKIDYNRGDSVLVIGK